MKAARVLAKQRCRRWAALAGALAVVAVMLAAACSPQNARSEAGEECFVASDCAPGLVCVPQRGGARVCSNDLSQVTGRPPAGPPAADAGDGGDAEASVTDGPGPDTGTDTGADTGVVDAADSG